MADIFQQRYKQSLERDPFDRMEKAQARQASRLASATAGVATAPVINPESAQFNTAPDAPTTYVEPNYRDKGTITKDFGLAVAKGGVAAAEGIVGLADFGVWTAETILQGYQNIGAVVAPSVFGEVGTVENSGYIGAAVGETLKDSREHWEDKQSDQMKRMNQNHQLGMTEKDRSDYEDTWRTAYVSGLDKVNQQSANASAEEREAKLNAYNANFNKSIAEDLNTRAKSASTSMDKTFLENVDAFGQSLRAIADSPAVAFDAVGSSLPSVLVGGVAGRGLGAVAGATAREGAVVSGRTLSGAGAAQLEASAARVAQANAGSADVLRQAAAQASVGEGAIMLGSQHQQLVEANDFNPVGDSARTASLATGALGAGVAFAGAKLANRWGVNDIDVLATGAARREVAENVANSPLTAGGRLLTAIAIEAGEEGLQTTGETINANLAQGKDPLAGLNTNVVLGMAAGGIMGAATNLGRFSEDIANSTTEAVTETVTKVKEKLTSKSYEELSDIEGKHYDPGTAYQTLVPKMDSTDKAVSADAVSKASDLMSGIETDLADTSQKLNTLVSLREQVDPANTEELKGLDEDISMFAARYGRVNDQYISLQAKIAEIEEHRKVTSGEAITATEVKDIITTLSEAPTPENAEAQVVATETITKNFSKLNSKELFNLADMPNVYSPDQQDALRMLAKVKQDQNTKKNVHVVNKDVYEGQKLGTAQASHRGLNDYITLLTGAIDNRNSKLADALMTQMERWTTSHTNKYRELDNAFNSDIVQGGGTVQVVSGESNQWYSITDRTQFIKDIKSRGGWTVSLASNQNGAIDLVGTEARDIESAYIAFDKMMSAFGDKANDQSNDNSSNNAPNPTNVNSVSPADTPVPTSNGDSENPALNQSEVSPSFDPFEGIGIDEESGQPSQVNNSSAPTATATTESVSANASRQSAPLPEPGMAIPNFPTEVSSDGTVTPGYSPEVTTAQVVPETVSDATGLDAPIETGVPVTAEGSSEAIPNMDTQAITLEDQSILDAKELAEDRVADKSPTATKPVEAPTAKAEVKSDTVPKAESEAKVEPKPVTQNVDEVLERGKSNNRLTTAMKTDLQDQVNKVKTHLKTVEDSPLSSINNVSSLFDYAVNNPNSAKELAEVIGKDGFKSVVKAFKDLAVNKRKVRDRAQDRLEPETGSKVGVLNGATLQNMKDESRKPFRIRNILVAHFDQHTTLNPLTRITNFISKLNASIESVAEAITGITPNTAQMTQLKDFKVFSEYFSEVIRDTYRLNDPIKFANVRHKDFTQYLANEQGQLDENTVSAMVLGVYAFFIEKGSKVANNQEDVSKLLHVDGDAYINPYVMDQLRHIGKEKNVLVYELGTKASKLLGLKATDDSDSAMQSRMDAALGGLMYVAMQNADWLVETSVPKERIELLKSTLNSSFQSEKSAQFYEDDSSLGSDNIYRYARLNYYVDGGEPHPDVKRAMDLSKGTKSYLSKLFDSNIGLRTPSIEPVERLSTKISRTNSSVPSKQIENMNSSVQNGLTLRTPVVSLFKRMFINDTDLLLDMLGAHLTDDAVNAMHINRREDVVDAARNERRALESALDWAEHLEVDSNGNYQEFFDSQYTSANNRMYYNSNMFNIQTSQIHRAMGGLTGYTAEINLEQISVEGKERDKYVRYMQSVAEGMEGVAKTLLKEIRKVNPKYGFGTTDKVDSKDFLPVMEEYLNQDAQFNAVVAMSDLMKDVATDDQKQLVKDTVAKWDMGAKSVLSLIALAQLYDASESGAKSITSTMALESDGVNNGVATANLQTGVMTSKMGMQTGVIPFMTGTQFENMQDVYRAGVTDYYVDFGVVIADSLSKIAPEDMNDSQRATQYLFKAFNPDNMRKIAKTWTVPFNYNASFFRLKTALGEFFVEGIYDQFESLAKEANTAIANKDTDAYRDVRTRTENMGIALEVLGVGRKLPAPEKLLEYTFHVEPYLALQVEEILIEHVSNFYGQIAEDATIAVAQDYIRVRDIEISMHKAAFTVSKFIRDRMITQKTQEMRNKGLLDSSGFEGLSKNELASIDKQLLEYAPILKSVLANQSENSLESGISLVDHTTQLEAVEAYRATVASHHNLTGTKDQVKTLGVRTGVRKSADRNVGVKGFAAQVQAVDAAVSSETTGNNESSNFHDSNGTGVENYLGAVNTQNEAWFNAMLNQHLQLENLETFTRSFEGLIVFADQLGITQKEVNDLVASIMDSYSKKSKDQGLKDAIIKYHVNNRKGIDPRKIGFKDLPMHVMHHFFTDAVNLDLNKLTTLENAYAIHQYAGEGGAVVLTDAHRAKIAKAKADIGIRSKELLERTKLVAKGMKDITKVSTESKVVEVKTKRLDSLQQFFNDRLNTPIEAVDVLRVMRGAKLTDLDRSILNSIRSLFPANLVFNYFDPMNVPNTVDIEGVDVSAVHGWYDSETNTINIKSLDSRNSKVDKDLVIHELLHAALAVRINDVRKNPDKHTPQVKEAVERLEELRKTLIEQHAPNDQDVEDVAQHKATVTAMLENVDEFISYALTDDRLRKVMETSLVPSGNRKQSRFTSVMKDFMNAIATILGFRGKQVNALQAFAYDVSELIHSLPKEYPLQTVGTLFSANSFTNPRNSTNSMTTLEIFKSLDSTGLTDTFDTHLDSVVDTTLANMYNHDGKAKDMMDDLTQFISSEAIKSGFNMTDKEEAVQQAVYEVMGTYEVIGRGTMLLNQMSKMYEYSAKLFHPQDFHKGDWSTATQQEKDLAFDKHNYVFGTAGQGKLDHIARFASMALANEEVRSLLDIKLPQTKVDKSTWFNRLTSFYSMVVEFLSDKYVRLNPKAPMARRIDALMKQLITIDKQSRQKTETWYDFAWNSIGLVTTPLNKVGGNVAQTVFDRPLFTHSRFRLLRTAAKLSALTPTKISTDLPNAINIARNAMQPNARLGEVMELINEISSPSQLRKAFDKLIRRTNSYAQLRMDAVAGTKKAILSMFPDNGKHLTKAVHKAVSNVVLRGDLQSLLSYTPDTIYDFVRSKTARMTELARLEKSIRQLPNGGDMINRAISLGYYLATGKGGAATAKNGAAIASGLETHYQMQFVGHTDATAITLDQMASLYSMNYQSTEDMKELKNLINDNKEAVTALLHLHESLVKDAAVEFADNPISQSKGYIPEITNPHRAIKVVHKSEVADLVKSGWKNLGNAHADMRDANTDMYVMVHHNSGKQRIVSGAIDLLDTSRKGTPVLQPGNPEMKTTYDERMQESIKRASIPSDKYDPSKDLGLIATFDTDGNVLSYSYEMDYHLRNEALQRNNNFADLLSSYQGMNLYKPVSKVQHGDVAATLFKDYKDNYRKDPKAYVSLSHDSTNPKDVEMWRMLPHSFKEEASKLFGKGNPIIIRNDVMTIAFGYKKYSITEMFDKAFNERNAIEKILVGFLEAFMGVHAKNVVGFIERAMQAIVGLAKDIIVIRSLSVMWGNIMSNVLLLAAKGINPVQMGKDMGKALYNVRRYKEARNHILEIEADIRMKGDSASRRQQIDVEHAKLLNNPLSAFISAGMLSSIVEDVNVLPADYTYKSELAEKVDSVTGWIPDPIKTIAKWLVISPDTKPYQFLAEVTQLSDFVAKYSLAEHNMREGMSFDDATNDASRTFINYDVPTGKGMQYMNDVGLFMFTKFFVRFQAVLLNLMDKRAASVIGQYVATEMLTDLPSILDPLMLNRLGNFPLEGGALNIVSAVGELPVVKLIF